jgi:hypothetical protein
VTFRCPPPDRTCLWRVSGVSRLTKRYVKHVGLIRAPSSDVALRQALHLYAAIYTDLEIGNTPLVDVTGTP